MERRQCQTFKTPEFSEVKREEPIWEGKFHQVSLLCTHLWSMPSQETCQSRKISLSCHSHGQLYMGLQKPTETGIESKTIHKYINVYALVQTQFQSQRNIPSRKYGQWQRKWQCYQAINKLHKQKKSLEA